MQITLRLFAVARDRVGREAIALEVPAPATVGDVRRSLAAAYPALAPLVPFLRFALGSEYAADEQPVPPDAELAAIPPVSGGTEVGHD